MVEVEHQNSCKGFGKGQKLMYGILKNQKWCVVVLKISKICIGYQKSHRHE